MAALNTGLTLHIKFYFFVLSAQSNTTSARAMRKSLESIVYHLRWPCDSSGENQSFKNHWCNCLSATKEIQMKVKADKLKIKEYKLKSIKKININNIKSKWVYLPGAKRFKEW